MNDAKPGDLVQVTIYAKVTEPLCGIPGGYWVDIHGVSIPVEDPQIQSVVNMENLSIKAQRILQAIYNTKGRYLATWSLSHLLEIGSILDPVFPRTEWDHAMCELIDAGLIEELPDLGCRYRLTIPDQQSTQQKGDQ